MAEDHDSHVRAWRDEVARRRTGKEARDADRAAGMARQPASLKAMEEAYDRAIAAKVKAAIEAGRPAPRYPNFYQALKAGFLEDRVDEIVNEHNEVISANTIVRLTDKSVIARLLHHRYITPGQAIAAKDYETVHRSAQMEMRVTGSYGQGSGSGAPDLSGIVPTTLVATWAREELRQLQSHVGSDMFPLLERVVIQDQSVESMGRACYPRWEQPSRRSAMRAGMSVLKYGLMRTAEYFHSGKKRSQRYVWGTAFTAEDMAAYFERGSDQAELEKAIERIRARNARHRDKGQP